VAIIRKSKRPKRGKRRLDLSGMKKALQDDRVWTKLAVVTTDDDSGSHFELDGEDLLVEVELIPGEERLTARMGLGGNNAGLFLIPPVGTEVVLLIPDGEFDCGPCIVGILSTGAMPGGLAEGVAVLAAAQNVLIHDGSDSGVDQLVFKTAYEAHVHPTGVGPSGVADNAAAPTSYTQVLKAK